MKQKVLQNVLQMSYKTLSLIEISAYMMYARRPVNIFFVGNDFCVFLHDSV